MFRRALGVGAFRRSASTESSSDPPATEAPRRRSRCQPEPQSRSVSDFPAANSGSDVKHSKAANPYAQLLHACIPLRQPPL